MNMGIKMTMRDVARAAEVGVGTVSRVLNLHEGVSADSVQRVLQAAQSTGYVRQPRMGKRERSAASRRLKGVVRDIVVLFFDDAAAVMGDPEALCLLRGVEQALAAKEINMMVECLSGDVRRPNFLMRRRVDGVVLVSRCGSGEASRWMQTVYAGIRHLPHVWLNARPRSIGGDVCATDLHMAGAIAADHLSERGCGRAHFFGPGPGFCDTDKLRHAFLARAGEVALAASADESASEDADEAIGRIGEKVVSFAASTGPVGFFVPSYRVALAVADHLVRENLASRGFFVLSCVPEKNHLEDRGGCLEAISLCANALNDRMLDHLLWRISTPPADLAFLNLLVEPMLIRAAGPINPV